MQWKKKSLINADSFFIFVRDYLVLVFEAAVALLYATSKSTLCTGIDGKKYLLTTEISFLVVNGLSSVTFGHVRDLSWQCCTRHQQMQLCASLLLSDVATLLEDFVAFIQLSCPKLNISVFNNETWKVACLYSMLLSVSVVAWVQMCDYGQKKND